MISLSKRTMMDYSKLFSESPYSMDFSRKRMFLEETLNSLTRMHFSNCSEYKKILSLLKYDCNKTYSVEDLPFIPVSLFKKFDLISVPNESIVKRLHSSGTTGQSEKKIYLDSDNVLLQTKALNSIIGSYIGKQRLPLIILDSKQSISDRKNYSARGAGIIGFSIFGKNSIYALDENMNFSVEKIIEYIQAHKTEPILLFGYTYMIWLYVVEYLEKHNISLNIPNGIIFHIGGWKKIKDAAISFEEFNLRLKKCLGNVRIHNYYGMVEHLGSVFVECECGHMHCSNFSDVIVRDENDFSVLPNGEKGLIEVLSVLPVSYPGHVLLTQDLGEILGQDDCPCGRKGKYFRLHGRVKYAEIRGCSDTFERS